MVNASAWLIDPELNYYNPYMNDIVQVVREYVLAAGPQWTDLKAFSFKVNLSSIS